MATLDWVTLAEAKAVARYTGTTANDTELTAMIAAVSQRLDEAVGPVVYRDIIETLDGEGTMLQLASWPVVTVSNVVEDGTTLTSVDWLCDYEKGQLYRRFSEFDYPWWLGRDNVEVTYRAGRYATTAVVDERWKHGFYLMMQHQLRARQWNTSGIGTGDFQVPQVAFPAFSVPNAVVEWFGLEWRDAKRGGFA